MQTYFLAGLEGVADTCQRYDFNTDSVIQLNPMETGRMAAAAFALDNGDLVVTGGHSREGCEDNK